MIFQVYYNQHHYILSTDTSKIWKGFILYNYYFNEGQKISKAIAKELLRLYSHKQTQRRLFWNQSNLPLTYTYRQRQSRNSNIKIRLSLRQPNPHRNRQRKTREANSKSALQVPHLPHRAHRLHQLWFQDHRIQSSTAEWPHHVHERSERQEGCRIDTSSCQLNRGQDLRDQGTRCTFWYKAERQPKVATFLV